MRSQTLSLNREDVLIDGVPAFRFLCGCLVSFVGGRWCGCWSGLCVVPFGCAGSFFVAVGGSSGGLRFGVSCCGLVLFFLFLLFSSFSSFSFVSSRVWCVFALLSSCGLSFLLFPLLAFFSFFPFEPSPLSSPPFLRKKIPLPLFIFLSIFFA